MAVSLGPDGPGPGSGMGTLLFLTTHPALGHARGDHVTFSPKTELHFLSFTEALILTSGVANSLCKQTHTHMFNTKLMCYRNIINIFQVISKSAKLPFS